MSLDLSASQKDKVKRIEKITSAYVEIERRWSSFQSETLDAWLRPPLEKLDGMKEEDDNDDDTLAYIADQPRKNPMTEKEIARYPEYLQNNFTNLSPEETCNVVFSIQWNESIDKLLDDMLLQTELLHSGWHLGRECDFCDPFMPPPPPPKSEEDLIWEEYMEEKRLQQELQEEKWENDTLHVSA